MWKVAISKTTYNFTHVQDDDSRLKTDTKTGNKTTSNDDTKTVTRTSNHLNDNTKSINDASRDNGPFATNDFGYITTDDCAKEGTSGEDGDNERLTRRGKSADVGTFDDMNENL